MKSKYPLFALILIGMALLGPFCSPGQDQDMGGTGILKWKDGKRAAISLTYDDGSINQFRVALPLMEENGIHGTFFINTGQIRTRNMFNGNGDLCRIHPWTL